MYAISASVRLGLSANPRTLSPGAVVTSSSDRATARPSLAFTRAAKRMNGKLTIVTIKSIAAKLSSSD